MKGNDYSYKLPSIEELKHLYFEEKLSALAIASKYGVTTGAVYIKFRRANIRRRSMADSQSLNANYISLSNELIDFINGLLLGDGCVVYSPYKRSCTYSHTDKNKDYLIWLKDQFLNFGVRCGKIKSNSNNTYAIRTLYYRDFVVFRVLWYPDGKKKIPLDCLITPIGLFNWYIGDGSYYKHTNGRTGGDKVVICSEFDRDGRDGLSKQLNNIGISNTIYKNALYIKAGGRKTFFNYITNHNFTIPECYKYKFNFSKYGT